MGSLLDLIRVSLLRLIYANHNSSPSVRKTVNLLIPESQEGTILKVGLVSQMLYTSILNHDACPGNCADMAYSPSGVPMIASTDDLVICKQLLECVSKAFPVIREIEIVLKNKWKLYSQFLANFEYYCSKHYSSLSANGIRRIAEENGYNVPHILKSVRLITSVCGILIELRSMMTSVFYKRAELTAEFLFYSRRFLDRLSSHSVYSHRLAVSFFGIPQKYPAE